MRYPLSSFFLRADVARRSKAAHIARSSPHQVVGIHHAKRFDVDEILYQHCVKKLLVGYLVEELPGKGPVAADIALEVCHGVCWMPRPSLVPMHRGVIGIIQLDMGAGDRWCLDDDLKRRIP